MIVDCVIDDRMIRDVCERLGLDVREVVSFLNDGELVMEEDFLGKMLVESELYS